ncbi:hypothetical protein SeMB42_g07604 [Synchytrium endobioticum]|uniref:CobW/HypB/UreG nucleotide-binding domain-containing protein n=1 Tax=Synchytrium endobioticum TaxID=286115 RepID=A0A507BU52_9FUNG|nr:hypothetical protein SeMB42_g07604 [Synchytrium endobioticum]TPX44066.1 hypothetical protein SeLEV6574_g04726 [Synchytrium endobioticum]
MSGTFIGTPSPTTDRPAASNVSPNARPSAAQPSAPYGKPGAPRPGAPSPSRRHIRFRQGPDSISPMPTVYEDEAGKHKRRAKRLSYARQLESVGRLFPLYPGNQEFYLQCIERWLDRDWTERGFTVGIAGPTGSGKTMLLYELCAFFHPMYSIAVVTNDLYTTQDADFLRSHDIIPANRLRALQTGGCPHSECHPDILPNLTALKELHLEHKTEILFVEAVGDSVAGSFPRELVDYTIYVISASDGGGLVTKAEPVIIESDLLLINKTDLSVGLNVDVTTLDIDAREIRRASGPKTCVQLKHRLGLDFIFSLILAAFTDSGAEAVFLVCLTTDTMPVITITIFDVTYHNIFFYVWHGTPKQVVQRYQVIFEN